MTAQAPTKQQMKRQKRVRSKRPMVRAVIPSDPIERQSTTYMCELAKIPGGREFLATARFALKQRRLELLQQIEQIDEADAVLQKNLFWMIRARARSKQLRAKIMRARP
jgi:hypothetical protein